MVSADAFVSTEGRDEQLIEQHSGFANTRLSCPISLEAIFDHPHSNRGPLPQIPIYIDNIPRISAKLYIDSSISTFTRYKPKLLTYCLASGLALYPCRSAIPNRHDFSIKSSIKFNSANTPFARMIPSSEVLVPSERN